MSALRRTAGDEDGSVLIAVVGIMVVLTVLAIGAFSMADDNLFQAKHDRARAQALAVAEAGMEQALWLRKQPNAPAGSVYTYQIDIPNMGRCTIEASATGATTFHVIATGAASSTPQVTRTISTDILSMSIWDMFYAEGPYTSGTNGHINGNGWFYGSAYMGGDWPPSNGTPNWEIGPFFVKGGDFALDGNAHMGTEGKVDLYCDGTVSLANANVNLYTSVPDLPMPQQTGPELAVNRNTAIGECVDGLQGIATGLANEENRVTGDSTGVPTPLKPPYADKAYAAPPTRYYKVIDDDSVVNTSVAAFYIGKSAANAVLPSFGRPYDPAIGHSPDDFAWDAANRVLTVQGTVFIDAKDVWIKDVKWAGKGTLIVSGNVHVTGTWEPACFTVVPMSTADPGDEQGYPKKNCVGLSASGYIEMYSPSGYGPCFAGTYWTMGENGVGNNDWFHGEIVSPSITTSQNSKVWCTPGMSSSMPPSMPGGSGQIVAVTGWHEGRK